MKPSVNKAFFKVETEKNKTALPQTLLCENSSIDSLVKNKNTLAEDCLSS